MALRISHWAHPFHTKYILIVPNFSLADFIRHITLEYMLCDYTALSTGFGIFLRNRQTEYLHHEYEGDMFGEIKNGPDKINFFLSPNIFYLL